ncbi:unnamed protein product [Thelazia callipaeda]|uniref:Molybdopterin synthase sulfur carrier subunit n=1 Tax=Thelazia callipaeda TaxID=103827 RepID=A0A0N5CRG4_THECL|nr:unnamed protein product [Thelazia callipaeda]
MTIACVPVRIVLWGVAREMANISEKCVDMPKTLSYQSLKELIFREILAELLPLEKCCILALNYEHIWDHDTVLNIRANSEIAVIPPVSGG